VPLLLRLLRVPGRAALGRREYRDYIRRNEVVLHAGDTINEFGWDNKHAGINVLISKVTYCSTVRGIFTRSNLAGQFVTALAGRDEGCLSRF
jgi:hypothetical protein